MNLEEIKKAVLEGKRVCWSNQLYDVVANKNGLFYVVCSSNGYTVGLTHRDQITLSGSESDFYIAE